MSHRHRHSFEPATLSREGVERRDRVLGELHEAMDHRVARKRAVRTAAGVAFVMVVAAGALSVVWASRPGGGGAGAAGGAAVAPGPVVSTNAPKAESPTGVQDPGVKVVGVTEPASIVTMVATDPGIVERLSVPERASAVEFISDTALQRELASLGVDPGLVTINGRTLTTLASSTQNAAPRQ